ncbi:MAG: lipopolysaccharide biosynthesis protein [Faecalibacterium sp.]
MKQNQLRNNVLYNTIGNIIYYVSQYALMIMATNISGNAVNGMLATAMTIAATCLTVCAYGMRSFQISDFSQQYSDCTYLKSRYLTLGAAALLCTGFAFAVSYSAQQRIVILVYTLCRLSEGFVDVLHGYLQRAERMDLVGISFGIRGLISMLVFGVALWLTQDIVVTLLLMTALNWVYILVVDWPLSRKQADFSARKTLADGSVQPLGGSLGSLLWVCAPLAVYSFLNSAVGSVIKLYCERICGAEAFSNFNNIFGPVQILQVGAAYVFVPFMTIFAHAWVDKNKARYLKALGIASAAMPLLWVCGAVGAALLGQWGLRLLYGEEILASAALLQPSVVATVITTYVSILCYLLSMMRKMKDLIISNFVGIVASFAFAVPMITAYGIYGAAYATIAARALQAAVSLGFVLWRCKQQFAPEGQVN